jgi:hypothetical protein
VATQIEYDPFELAQLAASWGESPTSRAQGHLRLVLGRDVLADAGAVVHLA